MRFPIQEFALLPALLMGGCVLAPEAAKQESARVSQAGEVYRAPFDKRTLPELSAQPTWRDVLRRAFLANGQLEATYFEWAMAGSRIQQAGAYPNSPVSVGFEYMFSDASMKAWDRTTLSIAPDAMENLTFPSKAYQSAKVAWRDAQSAGERFRAAKFELQRQVLNGWVDYALLAEKVRVQRENLSLLKLLSDTAEGRVRAGGSQQDLLRTDVQYQLAENELHSMEAELPQQRAKLNALLGRAADAPLSPPDRLPSPRALPSDDGSIIAMGVAGSPQLAELAYQVQGRGDALERARMEFLPDINPAFAITGSIQQVVGAMVTLPTVVPRINGMIDEARADLRRSEAMARQTRLDRAAEYVATLYALRNNERQTALFQDRVLPAAERVLAGARQTYAAGTGGYLDLIESQRTLLQARLTVVETRAAREKALADLEALAGVDVETLSIRDATKPSSQPAGAP